jgi:hypothetical protein
MLSICELGRTFLTCRSPKRLEWVTSTEKLGNQLTYLEPKQIDYTQSVYVVINNARNDTHMIIPRMERLRIFIKLKLSTIKVQFNTIHTIKMEEVVVELLIARWLLCRTWCLSQRLSACWTSCVLLQPGTQA